MSHDFRKLDVFHLADSLVMDVYRATRRFPVEERYGLQSQLRRASVSVPSNIVEGSARDLDPEFVHLLRIARGSASEARYLITVADRLGFMPHAEAVTLEERLGRVVHALQALADRVAGSRKRGK